MSPLKFLKSLFNGELRLYVPVLSPLAGVPIPPAMPKRAPARSRAPSASPKAPTK